MEQDDHARSETVTRWDIDAFIDPTRVRAQLHLGTVHVCQAVCAYACRDALFRQSLVMCYSVGFRRLTCDSTKP